jgi:hypothetical protein
MPVQLICNSCARWLEGKTYGLRLILATAMTVVGAIMLVYNNPQVADEGFIGCDECCSCVQQS